MFNSVFGDQDIWNVKPHIGEGEYCKKEKDNHINHLDCLTGAIHIN